MKLQQIILAALAIVFAVALTDRANAQGSVALYCINPTGSQATNNLWVPCSSTNPLEVSGSFTPSGTQNVNITQILSAAPSLTNPLWVSPATGATFPVSGTVTTTPSGTQTTASVGTAALATGQASVTTGNITIVAARTGAVGTGRKTVCVTNATGTGPVYIGVTGVSTSTGEYLAGVAGASICLDTQAAIYGTVNSTPQTVSYTETY